MRLISRKNFPVGRTIPLHVLSTLPVFMFLFNKSAAANLITVSVFACGGHVLEDIDRRLELTGHGFRAKQVNIIGIVLVVLYVLVSILWSPDPVRSLDILAGVLLVLLAASLTSRLAGPDDDGKLRSFAFLIVMICAVAVIIEEAAGMKLHQFIGVRSETFVLKRTVLCTTILFLALARFAAHRFGLSVIVVASLLQAGAIAAAHSGAAAFGVIGFCTVIACRRLGGGDIAKATCVAWIAGCLMIAPFLGSLADLNSDGFLVRSLQAFHLRERIEIWKSFGSLVQEKPVFGYGFGSSQAIVGRIAVEAGFDPTLDVIRELHPHNAYLQIWVEFGLVGVVTAFALMLQLIRSMDVRDKEFSTKLGLTMFCCFVMLLSHSLWQPWWIASVAAAIIWLRVGARSPGGAS